MPLTQDEKNAIFIMIAEKKLTAERNEEIRGDEAGARAEIAAHAPELLRKFQEAQNGDELQKASLEVLLAARATQIATLQSVLAATE